MRRTYGGPRFGVGVIIKRDGRILLGKRKGSHGAGTWSFPGGKPNSFESIENCAIRETREETGLRVILDKMQRRLFTEDFFYDEDFHYITHYVEARHAGGEAQIMEPDKCSEWDWFFWDNLPAPLFLPVRNLIKQGYNPFY
ncbi:MAG: NUDIX domain-containing protein [Candidatus Pacearchaeota archaeon]|nr:NUDIX domain-containing protein [Candidatus Pacearchaeota archaeon]MDE1848813.1 NUDIX domain-containing protein [Nanoarchaeota archaeon]